MLAGLTHNEFWALTADEVHMSVEAYSKRLESEFYRVGIIASTIINFGYRNARRVVKPTDFLPKQRVTLGREQTPEEQLAIFKRIAARVNR